MSHHTRNLMLGLAVLPMSVGNCGAPVRNCAGQLVNQLGQIIKDVLPSGAPAPTPTNPDPQERYDCTIGVEPPDPDLRGYYHVRDSRSYANGWDWYTACVVSARSLGRSIPAVKITGEANTPDMIPAMEFVIDTAPLFGQGHGHYRDPRAANIYTWRHAYIEPT